MSLILNAFKRLHDPIDIIAQCVRWYLAYALSLRKFVPVHSNIYYQHIGCVFLRFIIHNKKTKISSILCPLQPSLLQTDYHPEGIL